MGSVLPIPVALNDFTFNNTNPDGLAAFPFFLNWSSL